MINRLYNSILNNYDNHAFLFQQEFFTYKKVEQRIIAIQQIIKDSPENTIGVFTHYHIDTYASLFALWFLGKTAVPINAETESINQKIQISGIKSIISALPFQKEIDAKIIESQLLKNEKESIIKVPEIEDNIMYVIFSDDRINETKGIPITFKNFNSYVKSFLAQGFSFTSKDKVIQPFELTFDASLDCYFIPLMFGACVFPLENTPVKYLQSIKLMNDNQITFAKFTPSMIVSLKPWFRKISLPSIKHFIFSCEPLELDLCTQFKSCVPNAKLFNLNGPTEATVECFCYEIPDNETEIKSFQNLVCIGKPMGDNKAVIIDSNENVLPENLEGRVCIAGNQVFEGYLPTSDINENSFFIHSHSRYFKLNNYGFIDSDGDYFFSHKNTDYE